MCFFLLTFLSLSADTKAKFVGNWSLDIRFNNSIHTETSYFEVTIENSKIIDSINWSDCSFIFANTKNFHLTSQRIFAYAIYFPEYESYFLFYMYPTFYEKNHTYTFFNAIIKEEMKKDNFTFLGLHEAFNLSFMNRKIFAQILSFNATLKSFFDSSINEESFILRGVQHKSKFNLSFIAQLIDIKAFSRKCAIFGTFYAITLILRFVGWRSMLNNFTTENTVARLSYISVLSNSLFDFSFCIYIINITLRDDINKSLILDFILEMGIYSIYENNVTGRVQFLRMRDFLPRLLPCHKSLLFIIFHLFMIIIYIFSFFAMNNYPLITTLFFNSFFIPQIIRSCIMATRKKNDSAYVITMIVYRVLFLMYFGAYPDNIIGSFYPKEAMIGIVLLVLQGTIVLLQNQYGGRFFIPPSLSSNSYDYFGHQVEEGTICSICLNPITESNIQARKVMTTPCNHSFHAECLTRWMDEELACPLCRSPLP